MKMSITRALVELKKLDSSIESTIANGTYVTHFTGEGSQQKFKQFKSKEDAANVIKASFDKIDTLIKNRQKIKSAIVVANATTKVKIVNLEMSIAEAIEYKRVLHYKSMLLSALRQQLNTQNAVVHKINDELTKQIDAALTSVYGSEKGKISESTYNDVANPMKTSRGASLFDPKNVADQIEKLVGELTTLESEIDFTLSEINAKTEIEVDLTS